MVKILNGEIVQDDDPRLRPAAAPGGSAGAQVRQRPIGRVQHDTTTVVDGEEGGGFFEGLGIDLSSYLGENSQPMFTSPSVELPGGYEIPEIAFTVQILFIVALVYFLAGPRGLLAVGFLWGLSKLSEGSGGSINAAAGVSTPAPASSSTSAAGGAVPRANPMQQPAGTTSTGSAGGGPGQRLGDGKRLGASGESLAGRSRLLREMDTVPQD
jgi:hypothetical protein